MEEQALIEAIAAGDLQAANRFVEAYLPVVLCAFRLRGIPRQDLEDLVQEFFTRLAEHNYRRLRSWRGDSSLKTWVAAVARNFACDWHRRSPEKTLPEEEQPELVDESDPSELQWAREQRRLISGMLARLPERGAQILRRFYLEEQTVAEIAAEMDMTANHVRVLKCRALQELRQHLAAGPLVLGAF